MRSISFSVFIFLFSFSVVSCNDKHRKNAKNDRFREDAVSLDSFKNELKDSRTDFLQSFANDDIPWQKWDSALLEKATSAQSPIMVLVGSSLGGDSRNLGKKLSENPALRKIITKDTLCTVVDTLTHPEIGSLCFHLLNEQKRSTTFPALLWLSHEGYPLGWIPIGELSGNELEIIITNVAAIVADTWEESFDYAIENSRSDNELRQRFHDSTMNELEELEDRDEIFRRSTRQLSALYSFGDRDLDYSGGLIPTNSLELLAIGSQSKLLTNQVRNHCKTASSEITLALIQEALKDHLDGSYFYARRTTDWSLPSFSKNISSQAKLAHMLFLVGETLENPELIDEGLSVLRTVENNWLAQSSAGRSPSDQPDEAGKFLWSLASLKEALTEEEISLAVTAFSLKQEGNIPNAVDPLENYYKLNSLRRRIPLPEIAEQLQKPVKEVTQALASISQKLLKHRQERTDFDTESTFSATDLALIIRAQVARAGVPQESLKPALALADRLLKEFYHPEKGLARVNLTHPFLQARCQDYAATARSFLLLYQATLDDKWLSHSLTILDEAIDKLKSETGLLAEVSEADRIIPFRQHRNSMIFGESSLGILDLCLNRAWAITGDKKYRDLLKTQEKSISPLAKISPVSHTDYLSSCALGTHPITAILQGDPKSPLGKKMLTLLNSQKHIPFLSIRAANQTDSKLPTTDTAVTLIQNGEVIGIATAEPDLSQLLSKIISGS